MAEPWTPGNYPPQVEFDNSAEPSMTQQAPMDEADVNFIMAKYTNGIHMANTGVMPWTNFMPAQYQDTGYPPYGGDDPITARESALSEWLGSGNVFADMLNRLRHAAEAFGSLPSDLRARFNNNPSTFVTWMEDPANAPEARELGIVSEGWS